MRYNKRKRRRKDTGTGKSFFAISVIVCGMLIYALYASSAGRWIMDNYIEPVFLESIPTDVEDNGEEGQDGNGNAEQNDTGIQAENADSQQQRTMSYEGFTMYAMQVGAFSAEENANEAAAEIKTGGGAGYVYHDGVYRVLAFGYGTEGEANTVKEQLMTAASMESSVFTVTVPRLDFKVTGEEKNLQAVDTAFKTYLSAKDRVGELALKLDTGELTKEQVINELAAIQKELDNAAAGIDKLSENDEKLGKFYTLYTDITALFEGVTDSDELLFSANVKSIYMEMVCRYSGYVKEISVG